MVERLGGVPTIPSRQGSIAAGFKGADGKNFYPLHLWADGTVSFSLVWLHTRSSLRDEGVRLQLLDGLTEIVGPTNTRNLKGFPSFRVEKLADPEIAARVGSWLTAALDRMR
jgi:hypothetical protein